MAKKQQPKANKSQACRDVIAENPDIKPADAVVLLKKQGLDISAAFFSAIKSQTRKRSEAGRPLKKRGRPAKAKKAKARVKQHNTNGVPPDVSALYLMDLARIVKGVGSIDETRRLLDALETLQEPV